MNKKTSLRLLIISYLISIIISFPAFALEFDTSIDDEIRRNYNPDKIEEDMQLPSLPKILKENANTNSQNSVAPITNIKPVVKQNPVANATTIPKSEKQEPVPIQAEAEAPALQKAVDIKAKASISAKSKTSYISLKKGTKIRVVLEKTISDRTPKGSKLIFVSRYPVTTTYFTIPMGTVFKGVVVDSHKPQLSANGGLIKININSMVLNGEIVPIEAYVTKANYKHVFFNNIKGKHKYLSSVGKSTRPGRHFFRKMFIVTTSLAQDGSSIIVAPFSFACGLVALCGNVIVSPITALLYKGTAISLPQNSNFEIKLSKDTFIYN